MDASSLLPQNITDPLASYPRFINFLHRCRYFNDPFQYLAKRILLYAFNSTKSPYELCLEFIAAHGKYKFLSDSETSAKFAKIAQFAKENPQSYALLREPLVVFSLLVFGFFAFSAIMKRLGWGPLFALCNFLYPVFFVPLVIILGLELNCLLQSSPLAAFSPHAPKSDEVTLCLFLLLSSLLLWRIAFGNLSARRGIRYFVLNYLTLTGSLICVYNTFLLPLFERFKCIPIPILFQDTEVILGVYPTTCAFGLIFAVMLVDVVLRSLFSVTSSLARKQGAANLKDMLEMEKNEKNTSKEDEKKTKEWEKKIKDMVNENRPLLL